MNENFWRFIGSMGKKLIFLSIYFSCLVGFFFLFSAYSTPLPLLKFVDGTCAAVGILSLLLLLIFGLAMVDIARERLSYCNNMDRITNKINRVLTGDRVAWHYVYAK